uniref:Immunoglobulin domain-containing protein n=1 Tax=Corvus moneduloides TaxID=1196302 RepID=A0A8C3EW07_CORMO
FPKLTGLSSFPPLISLVLAKSSRALEQSPLYANPEQGQSVRITCVLKSSPEAEGFYLLRTHVQPAIVLHGSKLNRSRVSPAFMSRLEYSQVGNRTVITLHDLQEDDSDNYVCAEEVTNSPLLSSSGTMVLVKESFLNFSQDRQTWVNLESGLKLLCALLSLDTETLCVSTCLVQPEGYSDLAIILHLRKRKKGQNKITNTSLCEICQF